MAWLHLQRHPIDDAHVLIRVGIIRLNAAHRLVETTTRGYHDTLTRVWLALVGAASRETPRFTASFAFLDTDAERLDKSAPLKFYSRERLMSVAARARFIEPNLEPLP